MTKREWNHYADDIARVAAVTRAVPLWVEGAHGWQIVLVPTRLGVDISTIRWRKRRRVD